MSTVRFIAAFIAFDFLGGHSHVRETDELKKYQITRDLNKE
jgi:hypothetical protein